MSFMWYKNIGTSFFHFDTVYAFDRQTDGRTDIHTDSFLVVRPRYAVKLIIYMRWSCKHRKVCGTINRHDFIFICTCNRLWFVYNTDSDRSTLQGTTPTEIGYMNVIPKCISSLSKYPQYEHLPETYVAINDYLVESPLEGSPFLLQFAPVFRQHISDEYLFNCFAHSCHVTDNTVALDELVVAFGTRKGLGKARQKPNCQKNDNTRLT